MSHAAFDPRCRFSVDDVVWCLRDTALYARSSIFENGFLRFWRDLHDETGLKVQLNIYYRDLDTGWQLDAMPDRFRHEWRENADWLKLSFHALADLPAEPYAEASYEEVATDVRLVHDEIVRFAGPETLGRCTTLHWGAATRDGCRALRDIGVEALVGYFRLREGRPWVSYYLDAEQTALMQRQDFWTDLELRLTFIRHDLVLNEVPPHELEEKLQALAADPNQGEVLELMIHEQYFYPRFPGYQAHAAGMVREAARFVQKRGYRWAFYEEWHVTE